MNLLGHSERDRAVLRLAEFERDGLGHWLDNSTADELRAMVRVSVERHRGAVEAERDRIVALIRREASETFDMQLDFEFRQLADRIASSGEQ